MDPILGWIAAVLGVGAILMGFAILIVAAFAIFSGSRTDDARK